MHRPINVLTVVSSIIRHVIHLAMGMYYLLNMITDMPLGDVFGSWYCYANVTIAVYGLGYFAVGGFGIAVYRLLYIRFELWVKYCIGEQILLWLLLFLSVTLTGLFTFLYMIEENGLRVGVNMCTGLSLEQTQVLIDYNISRGIQMLTTNVYQKTAVALCLAVQTIQFAIYMWLFYYRYKHDNGDIAKLLTQETVHKRNIKNATTLIGEMCVFVMASAFFVANIILLQLANGPHHHIRAIVCCLRFIYFGVLSTIEVYSSPELRKSMK